MFEKVKRKKKKKKVEKPLWYNGIHGVRNAKTTIELTEEQEEEIKKCAKDPLYFIENYIKIRNVDSESLIPMKLRSYQLDMIDNVLNKNKNIIMMARQMGKTSTISVIGLWYMMFRGNYKMLVLANAREKAQEIIEDMQAMIEHIPVWLQKGIREWNKSSIAFENGSKIKCTATTHRSGRGGTFNFLYIDEMAFIEDSIVEKLMKSVAPSISSGSTTKMVITSTPQGRNYFWKLWTKARRKNSKSSFNTLFYDWTLHPTRGEEFKNQIIADFDLAYWRREYECKFEGSSDTLIPGEILEDLNFIDPVRELIVQRDPYTLKIYKEPKEDTAYIMTVDPSEGLGKDYTAIHVWDVSEKDKRVQVAVLYDNELKENPAPYVITDIARMYNSALILYECNKVERVVSDCIEKCEYDYVWINPEDCRLGILMSAAKRNRGLAMMQHEFRNNRIVINDYDTIHELNTFINKRGKWQADEKEHDDLVTSMNLLMWFMTDEDRYDEYIEENVNYINKVHGMHQSSDSEPIIFFDDGLDIHKWGPNK